MKQEAIATESLLEIIEQKDKKIAELQERLDYILRQKFTSSSEKFPSNQPSLIYYSLFRHFLLYEGISSLRLQYFTYLKNQFSKLKIYVEDGRLNIDNNIAENHVRPIAISRKNWLFATSTKGATALCSWYNIIETAKANNLDAYAYLKFILTQLPVYEVDGKDIEDLFPWNVELDYNTSAKFTL